MELYLLLAASGAGSGFLSGLLGIGGGIITAPMLLFLPPLFGMPCLSMHTVAGLTIIQGLLSCFSGGLTHNKFNFVSSKLATWMGSTVFIAACLGGAASSLVSHEILLFIFAALAFVAAVLMFFPVKNEAEYPDAGDIDFSRLKAVSTASGVGILGGLVGQGGSFILIPLMTSYVQIPTRIAIGSNLAIVFLSSLAGVIGKAFTGQINWLMSIPIVLTVVPFSVLGGRISRKVPVLILRRFLAFIIAASAVCMCCSLLGN